MSQNKVVWIGRIITGLLAPFFGISAVMKLIPHPEVVKGMVHLELPQYLTRPLGVLELVCLIVYLIPATSVLGAVLLTGYLGGAILTHLRIEEPVYTQIILGGVVWLGIYLREPQLRKLLPVRRN